MSEIDQHSFLPELSGIPRIAYVACATCGAIFGRFEEPSWVSPSMVTSPAKYCSRCDPDTLAP